MNKQNNHPYKHYFIKNTICILLLPLLLLTTLSLLIIFATTNNNSTFLTKTVQAMKQEIGSHLEEESLTNIEERVGEIRASYQKNLKTQKILIWVTYMLLLLLLYFILYRAIKYQAKKTFSPLEELARSTTRLNEQNSLINIPTEDTPLEIQNIVENFNTTTQKLLAKFDNLKKLNINLQEKVEQRSNRLQKATERLKASQAELSKNSELAIKGEMSKQVVHEVLNPLSGMLLQIQKKIEELSIEDAEILGELDDIFKLWQDKFKNRELAELLATKNEDDTIGEQSFHIIQSYLKVLSIERVELKERFKFLEKGIHRIITILNILRKKKERKMESIDIRKIIQESMSFIYVNLKESDIEFNEEYEPDLPLITVDSGEMVEVFLNLFKNALQSIIQTETLGKIYVSGKVNKSFLEIRISDNGAGIPLNAEKKIFELGFTTKAAGSGFGLAICRRLMRGHGGDILLENHGRKSKLTTFLIKISLNKT
ncbi:sensor histidine kinase [Candidatus Auribacterota bacterium]